MAEFEKVYFRKDDSGHDYVVPQSDIEEFDKAMNRFFEADDSSDEWYDAINDLHEFDHYMAGGSLDNLDLYIKKDE